MDQTLAEAKYKGRNGGRGGTGGSKSIPLSDRLFRSVQRSMQRLIEDGLDNLSMFGSFFFVLEGKGLKLLTKDGQDGVHESPEIALRRNLSCLDWDYMLDHKNGELLVDVGISFTPNSPSKSVTGLWRLDTLEESYGAAGFNRGTIHHQCMLSRYGALQAEMNQERALQTHIAFRSTYNLYYEAVRTANNIAIFAKDNEAYNITPAYMAECKKAIKVFHEAKRKTYGVRDEYRVSGQAAQVLLNNIIPQAKRYMRSRPVLWIPSDTWFDFLARRVEEVQRTQITLSRRNPPNLGIMTGILNHMLRCVTSTPIMFDHHVRESLALLEYRNVLETANMFFLQELNINLKPCLEDVQEVDDAHVLALMGFNAKARRDRALASHDHGILSGLHENNGFPIGPTPTWTRLKQAITGNPALMLKNWSWSPRFLSYNLVITRLFCTFTTQMWLRLSNNAFKGIVPGPSCLEDAMRCWTVISIDDTLFNTTFEACNIGLENNNGVVHGRRGPRSVSFADRMDIFFPSMKTKFRKDSQWSPYWEGRGYIKQYHDLLRSRNEQERCQLNNALCAIFSDLQCLPASQKMTEKTKGFVWRCKGSGYLFVTNPKFYKVEGLSKKMKKTRRQPAGQLCQPGRGVKSKKVFTEDLWRSGGFNGLVSRSDQTDRQKRRALQKRLSNQNKSMASKNKRKPPQHNKTSHQAAPKAKPQAKTALKGKTAAKATQRPVRTTGTKARQCSPIASELEEESSFDFGSEEPNESEPDFQYQRSYDGMDVDE
ncbi:hypothetical protein HYDPIDRAFT_34815 [Hydnomerulius pinastri MD-312]|uniref:Unplaced genomic scaffold scaffold_298, whole genome shotgun sequence n=1 Tax=Hydnomerulius pinastri MD-312 TaxID=994086 RepID=A0A0C9VJW8_9AGAM|nr:hypothetical protein HYDPIDRAFT_34815 [Hydnomerulius pinastri MD-312]